MIGGLMHLKGHQVGGISAMAKHYHPEGNGECFPALLVVEVENVCGDAAAHVEEKKPDAAHYSNIVTVANLQRGTSVPLQRTKSTFVRPSDILAP
ncbi:hypothetical protein LZL87_002640 [Fusarium oxysporum]|nr:hypothetical protein LZL87_002640 [Fusarium oxysporum]